MEVELLWWAGCPSADEAIELVREEMRTAGLEPDRLEVREIVDDAGAQRERFSARQRFASTAATCRSRGTSPSG